MTDVTTTGRPQLDAAESHQSLATLVAGIVGDVQTLVKQQVDMVRAEFKEDMRHTKDVARFMGLGAVLAGVGGLFLLIAVAFGLPRLFPETLDTWSGFAIVGGLLFVGGLVAILVGRSILAKYNPLPDKSFNALQENLTWQTNETTTTAARS